MNKLARNERRKLTATMLNSLASGTILIALVGPFVGLGLGTIQLNTDMLNVIGLSAFGVVLASMVHRLARDLLKGMEE